MAVEEGSERASKQVEKAVGQVKTLYDMYSAFDEAFTGILDKVATGVDTSNRLRINFQKTFGILSGEQGRDLVKNVVDLTQGLKNQEISGDKLAEAFKEVGANLQTSVIDRSLTTITNFTKLTAINDKLGISMNNTITLVNQLKGSMGMADSQVESFSNRLVRFAQDTGQEFNKVFTEFNNSVKNFYTILDPDKAATQFMSFQQMARGFGTTIGQLTNIAAKFDNLPQEGITFGTQLNNVLSTVGGSFDAVLASTLNYDERIKYVFSSISEVRDNIGKMDEISQRAFIRQLQQSSQLDERTLQAILKNEKLVEGIEEMTVRGGFENLQEAKVEDMAKNFTSFQERANLFMNEYVRLGSRLEEFVDVSTTTVKKVQLQVLGDINNTIFKSKNLFEFFENIGKAFSPDSVKGTFEKYKNIFDQQSAATGGALKEVFEKGQTLPEGMRTGKSAPTLKEKTVIGEDRIKLQEVTSRDNNTEAMKRLTAALEKRAEEQAKQQAAETKPITINMTVSGDNPLLAALFANVSATQNGAPIATQIAVKPK